jgi:N-acetylmuramoyl-L-alanine amidase
VALDTALLLRDVADRNERSDLRIYYTRLSDSDVDREKRMSLIRDSHADIYIELGTDYSDDTSENGLKTYYNDGFFLRRLCNADLADILERNCAARSGARAIGVLPSEDEGDILTETKIPSAKISLGNLSCSEDLGRLSDEGYKKKLAEGIYNALIGAFEVME